MARVDIIFDESGRPVLDVVLSSRNLIVLLSKLATPGSACRLDSGFVPDGYASARFRAEPDDVHYDRPERHGAGPGEMHPIAEAVVAAVRTVLSGSAEQVSGPVSGDAPSDVAAPVGADVDGDVDVASPMQDRS